MWGFPTNFEDFEEEGSNDVATIYTNTVTLLRQYQLRARNA